MVVHVVGGENEIWDRKGSSDHFPIVASEKSEQNRPLLYYEMNKWKEDTSRYGFGRIWGAEMAEMR